MKMNELIRKTGLTERTVRFYVEKGLLFPETHEQNGRTYFDFSESDAERLSEISLLRKFDFSVETIRVMYEKPDCVDTALSRQREELREDAQRLSGALRILDKNKGKHFDSVASFAKTVSRDATRLKLPKSDIKPDFGKFDSVTAEEKEAAFREYEARQQRTHRIGKTIVVTVAVANILFTVISSFLSFNLLNLILQIIFSVILLAGYPWVRYLFAVGASIGAISTLILLFTFASELPAFQIVLLSLYLAYALASCILLFASRSVSEYLYEQKNG